MSKVATYLREHLLGEVSSYTGIRRAYKIDNGVLELTPEMVAFPRVTSDIRKVARFSWQLAEKGHVLPITVRGSGLGTTGAAVGRGVIVSTPKYMHQVFEFDAKQRLIRLQPGATAGALTAALGTNGSGIPALKDLSASATLGGTIAAGYYGMCGDKYGDISEWVNQLEVVLANGEVIQTSRISKRELDKRKGLQTMEGELYRSVDNLIDDNAELLQDMASKPSYDAAGYANLARVRRKDGSFDLTPLFIGSQGTLGIISEMILQTDFISFHQSVVALVFKEKTAARDGIDVVRKLQPAFAEYFDGEIFDMAAKNGKVYDWYGSEEKAHAAVIIVGFDDINAKVRKKKIAKLQKGFVHSNTIMTIATDDVEVAKFMAALNVTEAAFEPSVRGDTWPEILTDFYVPEPRFEEFTGALPALAEKLNLELPLYGHALTGVYSTRVPLHMGRVGDRQKIFKLLDEFASMLEHYDGYLVANGGDGRLKAKFALKHVDEKSREMYTALRAIFDPHATLNPGIKQDVDMRELAKLIKTE